MNTTNIPQLLDISENDHIDFIIDSGVAYLETQRAWTPIGKEKLMKSRLYWQWWWRNWLTADEAILANPLAGMAVEEYLRAHCRAHAYEMPRVMWSRVSLDSDCRMRMNAGTTEVAAR